jgi:hypothetical protein
MGKSKASIRASNNFKRTGQTHNAAGFAPINKNKSVEIIVIEEEESDQEDTPVLEEEVWVELIDDEEEENGYIGDTELNADTIDGLNVDVLEECINNLEIINEDSLPEYRHFGDSDRNRRRKKAGPKLTKLAAIDTNNNLLNSGFTTVKRPKIIEEISSDVEDNVDQHQSHLERPMASSFTEKELIQQALDQLEKDGFAVISKDKKVMKKTDDVNKFDYLRYIGIRAYLRYRLEGKGKVEASRTVAEVNWDKFEKFSYKTVAIRNWAKYYLEHHGLKPDNYSKQPRTKTIITDELVRQRLREHIRSITPKIYKTPTRFMEDLNNEILRTIPNAPEKVSLSTATRWMRSLGFSPHRHGKNYYVDGHERPDVVADRNERFLPKMEAYESRMFGWEGENMEIRIDPVLLPGVLPVIIIVHDESIVYSNDATRVIWEENGQKELRPKSNGKSQHISGFCCSCHGFILCELTGESTFKIITPGKSNDGYWTNSDLVAQYIVVAPIFERFHPGCKLVFVFDNSQNHHARAPGGLCAKTMLKGKGGKNQVIQRDTVYNGVPQQLWQQKRTPFDGPLWEDEAQTIPVREPKGLLKILTERNVQCSHMSVAAMRECLAEHEDFKNELGWLERVVTERGHDILYLPKFHCELNYIESVWAYVKSYCRRNCVFSFPRLKADLPHVLLSIPIACFKRFERHCLRFMSGYRQHNLHGPLLDYIMKKYSSHRKVPALLTSEVDKFKEEMLEKMKKKLGGK